LILTCVFHSIFLPKSTISSPGESVVTFSNQLQVLAWVGVVAIILWSLQFGVRWIEKAWKESDK